MRPPQSNLPPGFRFHPTDQELIVHYLSKKISSLPLPVSVISEVDIYKLDPWELPGKAAFGEKEWYFFSPRDRKYPNGARPNRAAGCGYWKATGTDKNIVSPSLGGGSRNNVIGVKKALVFYKGKPPKGVKTNWIMHEYRLAHSNTKPIKLRDTSMRLDDWVLCRIYNKSKHDSPSTPVADQPQATSITINPHHDATTLPSNKSLSFSNLLDAMDYSLLSTFLSDQTHSSNPSAPPLSDHAAVAPNIPDRHHLTVPPLTTSSGPKRQLSDVDDHDMDRKYHITSCSFPENNHHQYENSNPQWNFIHKQPLLTHHLLIAPHLRFQG